VLRLKTERNAWQRYLQAGCFVVILVVGLILRLGTAAGTEVDHPIRNDAKEYVAYAWNLKYLGIYSPDFSTLLGTSSTAVPDAVRPPGYPLWLDVFLPKYIDGTFANKVAYAQAWVATVTLLCITLLAMDVLGAWAGLVVGLLVALSPHQSVFVAYLLSETLYGAVLVLALGAAALSLKFEQPHWRYVLAAVGGVLFGISCLVRPTLNQWVPALLLLLLVPAVKPFRRQLVALALGFFLIMSPWWIRNEITIHKLSDATKMVVTIQQGSYVDLMYEGRPETFGAAYRFDPAAEEIGTSWTRLFADLRAKFAAHPISMIRWYLFGKIAYFFSWSSAEGWGDIFTYPVFRSPWLTEPVYIAISSIMQAAHVPLILLGILGMVFAYMPATMRLFGCYRADVLRFFALLHLFAIGVHVVGLPIARYSVPFMPITFLLAIFFVVWLVRRYREYKRRELSLAVAHD
jgi:hypothetical protein